MKDRDLDVWDDDEWTKWTEEWSDSLRKYIGSRLRTIQRGGHPTTGVEPLTDFDIKLGEIKHRDGTRVVFTAEFADLTNCVHVLDVFLKDSKEGSEMRKSDKTRIKARVKALRERMKPLEAEAKAKKQHLH